MNLGKKRVLETEKALDRNLWRICFGKGYVPVTRHTTERINQ
jgi:hypothetical protein